MLYQKMKSVFLGTGAAELYPNPFCNCETCRAARENRETRLRSAFLLDPETMIDFGPDVAAASQHYGVDLSGVRNVLITHTHKDHFSDATFNILTMTTGHRTGKIDFWMSPEAYGWVEKIMEEQRNTRDSFGSDLRELVSWGMVAFHVIPLYTPTDIGGKTVVALKTNHQGNGDGEFAQNYLITWERGTWIYACDCGVWGEENLAYLAANLHHPADVMISEGTFGSAHHPVSSSHMTAENLCVQIDRLRNIGVLDGHSQFYITHINQVQDFTQSEYQTYMHLYARVGVTVAYDGMRI